MRRILTNSIQREDAGLAHGKATDTSERGLERLICTALVGHPCDPPKAGQVPEPQSVSGGVGWNAGNPHNYDREFCVDRRFSSPRSCRHAASQPPTHWRSDEDGPTQRKFLARLQGEVSKRGTIDVLRHGVRSTAHTTWSCSTAHRRQGTSMRRNASSRTASRSPVSFGTAATRRSGRSTSGSSSTGCRSSPSS